MDYCCCCTELPNSMQYFTLLIALFRIEHWIYSIIYQTMQYFVSDLNHCCSMWMLLLFSCIQLKFACIRFVYNVIKYGDNKDNIEIKSRKHMQKVSVLQTIRQNKMHKSLQPCGIMSLSDSHNTSSLPK